MLLLSELPLATVLTLAARAARRPVQVAVHCLRRQPGRQGPSVLAGWGRWSRGMPILAREGTAGPDGTRVAAADRAAGSGPPRCRPAAANAHCAHISHSERGMDDHADKQTPTPNGGSGALTPAGGSTTLGDQPGGVIDGGAAWCRGPDFGSVFQTMATLVRRVPAFGCGWRGAGAEHAPERLSCGSRAAPRVRGTGRLRTGRRQAGSARPWQYGFMAEGEELPERVLAGYERAARTGFRLACQVDVGRLLAALAAAVPGGGRVLEIGTGVGVGLAWLVHGLGARQDVEVVTVELDDAVQQAALSARWPPWVRFESGEGAEAVGRARPARPDLRGRARREDLQAAPDCGRASRDH